MRNLRAWIASIGVLAGAVVAYAENAPLDCSKKSLADAVREVSAKDLTISFTRVCAGPIVVAIDGLTLQGVGTAIIDGGGSDAVTVAGANRVSLIDLEVTNGQRGIFARDGAHISVIGVSVHGNSGSGIVFVTSSTGNLSDVAANGNGGTGLIADNGVGITIANFTITGNTVRDIQLNVGYSSRPAEPDIRRVCLRRNRTGPGRQRHRLPALELTVRDLDDDARVTSRKPVPA